MERVLLYYPTINIPDNYWLRNSLLYTDKIASIVPYKNMFNYNISDEMRMLYDHGQYIPIGVLDEINSKNKVGLIRFENDYINALESEDFKNLTDELGLLRVRGENQRSDYDMYLGKLTRRIREYLEENNLMLQYNDEKASVNKYAAAIYMAMLADYLARNNENYVIPSTDQQEYEKISFQLSNEKVVSQRLYLEQCLPTPSPIVSLKDIISFKQERKDELLEFRVLLDDFEKKLSLAKSEKEIKGEVIKFKEKIKSEVSKIKKVMGDTNFKYTTNTLSSLIDIKKPDLLTGTIASVISAGSSVLINESIGLGGAAIILALTSISAFKKMNREPGKSTYSYVYYAEKKGLIG